MRKLDKGWIILSEFLNDSDSRREQLKKIILSLHAGQNPETLKQQFKELLHHVGASEIGHLEQDLISSGDLSENEVKKLCDIHAAVFEETLKEQSKPAIEPGHPIDTMQKENRALEELYGELHKVQTALISADGAKAGQLLSRWWDLHQKLLEIEKHFSRKENIIFAYLEKYGVSGPPKVMWALHDDIRVELKKISQFLETANREKADIQGSELSVFINQTALPVLTNLEGLIFKEEHILFPMCLENFSTKEWVEIYQQEEEIGYTLIQPSAKWQPNISEAEGESKEAEGVTTERGNTDRYIKLDTGVLSPEQLNLMLKHLPVDITFVDKDDTVKYFSQGPERIFVRTPAIIGRKVQNCHPPDSVHVVEKIVQDFKSGQRNRADFWLPFNGMYVYISYFAVRDDQGNYVGTMEVSQNIQPLQAITGERRILEDS